MDALISPIISELTSIISSWVREEYKLVVGVKEEIIKLKSDFITIQAVLEDAERRQTEVKDVGVRYWLDELKQVCYDMEDVLADWRAEYHEWEIKSKLKVHFFAGCCSPLNRCFNQVRRRHDIAHRIKGICERLDQIDKKKSSYNFSVYSAPAEEHERHIISNSRITTSHVDALKMRGRDDEKKNVISKLLCTIDQKSTREVPVAAIVGVGGIGKTTLAQLAYNDEEVKAHFQERIWICVSEPFDKVNIAREIIRKLDNSSPVANSSQLDLLLDKISELVKEKRFLLVLDDVWNENRAEWEQLKLSLGRGNPQSRILVTTRKDNVAKVMGTTYFLPIGLLSDDECWLVFRQLAFSGRSEDECKKLEEFFWKIVVEKVKGLPLAVNILGGLLQLKESKRQWEDVLSSNLWELEGVESKLFGPLLLSYYDLPAAIRRCFTYCAMFPKDTTMRKSNMIRMWMAQGYLNKATSSKEMELVGEEYFDNLVVRSFFQNLEEHEEDIEFKMHDIVHDSAQILSGNECFSCTGKEIRTESYDNERVRHLSLLSPSREDLESVCSAKSLRSLYIEDRSETIVEALPKLLRNLKYLRALYLGSHYIKEIPSEVKELKHLRYLNLWDLELTKIMELSKLWNLETLYLQCRDETSLLGIGIEKLINLRHLHIISTDFGYPSMFLPKGIGRLTSLRTLKSFRVGDETKGTTMLRELQDMNQLEGILCIRGLGKVVDVDEAVKAHLKNKKRLTHLTLQFSEDELINNQSAVLEALEGPLELEWLGIWNYKGALLLPNWIISLTNLTQLHFVGSKTSVDLVALARLPSLEILGLELVNIRKYNMGDEEEEEGGTSSVVARFPKLKQLSLLDLEELEESVFAAAEMPPLIRFLISNCPKMKDLPDCILTAPQLQELTILGCPILYEHYNKESGKYWNKISHIPKVITSDVDALKIRSRDDDKKNLINKLLRTIDQKRNREVPVAAIVGVGGIGKTTLAKLAYNDEEVKAHFEERVWICVSEPFDKVNIAREIIRKLDNSSPVANSSQLDLLLDKISKLVKEKRFLLILDDVWNENRAEWEQLKLSLGCGNPQSRILVTTRKDNVAKVMGTTYFLHIGLLSDDECWLIFRELAFSERSEDECKRLEDKIVQFKMSRRQWEDVFCSNLWEDVQSKFIGP